MVGSKRLATQVRSRARGRCEYCHLPERFSPIAHEIDRIVAEQHGGETVIENLALACFADNHHKGPNIAGVDPKTRRKVWLFNPRRHKWTRHFRWHGATLLGRTPSGRATVALLRINDPHRIALRLALMIEGVFPTTKS